MHEEIDSVLNDFERKLFKAAERNFLDVSNPLRLNNYAYSTRELTRHVLHRLSLDEEVTRCSWYKNESKKEGVITRKERAYYAVQGGLDDLFIEKELGLQVQNIHDDLIRAITTLNKYTHIEEKTFNEPIGVAEPLVSKIRSAVQNFFSTIVSCRKNIINVLWEKIDSAVIDETLKAAINSIDHLATHSYIDEIYTDKVRIIKINHESIIFQADGSISCDLQWGSNSDLRDGNGAVLSPSFPFTCNLFSPVENPNELAVQDSTLSIDTSSWEDVMYGQDESR